MAKRKTLTNVTNLGVLIVDVGELDTDLVLSGDEEELLVLEGPPPTAKSSSSGTMPCVRISFLAALEKVKSR